MLKAHRDKDASFSSRKSQQLSGDIIWIDLLNPTDAEKQIVAERVDVQVPSIETLSEIESSSIGLPN